MDFDQLIIIVATAIAAATPIVFAAIGETVSERAGVVNLSADGVLMLAGLGGFAVAKATDSVWLGFGAAAIVGSLVASVVAFTGITLKQSQIAVGFVLALLSADLASFLGSPLILASGPRVPSLHIDVLKDIPVLGPLLFQHDLVVYASFALVAAAWLFFYRTRKGLILRAIGEQPAAAFARGVDVMRLRYVYTILGGLLVGIAGAAFTLDIKAGWTNRHTAGYGWIALAIVIFGGWNPLRAALGAYVFGVLQSLASVAQSVITDVPTSVFNVLPFVLMIFVLIATSGGWVNTALARLPIGLRRYLQRNLRSQAPAALGRPFEQD